MMCRNLVDKIPAGMDWNDYDSNSVFRCFKLSKSVMPMPFCQVPLESC